jgi:hypothetical protein
MAIVVRGDALDPASVDAAFGQVPELPCLAVAPWKCCLQWGTADMQQAYRLSSWGVYVPTSGGATGCLHHICPSVTACAPVMLPD